MQNMSLSHCTGVLINLIHLQASRKPVTSLSIIGQCECMQQT